MGPEKITINFPVKIKFTCYSMGLTRNCHGKKRGGGGADFFEVWTGGPENFMRYFCFASGLPYKCLWTVPNVKNISSLMISSILLDYACIKGIFSSFESAQHHDLCMNCNVILLFKPKTANNA